MFAITCFAVFVSAQSAKPRPEDCALPLQADTDLHSSNSQSSSLHLRHIACR
ncbi:MULTISPECIES: hypothetical protein [Bradyrhizobium]|jgi:hypothetical protein|nr:hypothetical protein [Bradyrhizobium diazoefficiens]MBR0868632.1 hypothetical protein [Bradyrhizobium diazoefficiens]MBR0893212.1 hypothetical protein [Bradyrhizobium diazoefficiens]MBR0924895.1 hypothetical protein [Bradyrhizobium diazoefficiens]MCD9834145.1 hypothetical protein [Bradyrhizobium diazoefficiens]MCD9889302.1 hypothetical protein [Bradyrhizobium diazoefficiens]